MAQKTKRKDDFEYLEGEKLFVPKSLTERRIYSRIDMGTHYEVRCSIASDQLGDCLKQVENILEAQGLDKKNVVQQTVFVPSENYEESEAMFYKQLEDFYGVAPTTSFVGQTPAGNKRAMEVVLLAPKEGHDLRIRHEAIGETRYTTAEVDGSKWVYAAGLTGRGAADTSDNAREAFKMMKAILEREGLSFQDVVLQKNYIDNICGPNYNKFNVVRESVYTSEGLVENFPAATGIGELTGIPGHVTLELVALRAEDASLESVENPRQRPSYRYSKAWLEKQVAGRADERGLSVSQLVGGQGIGQSVSTPKFSRGKYIRIGDREYFLVSGTAAIVGREIQFTEELKEPAWIDVGDVVDSLGVENVRERGIGVVAFPDGKMRVKANTAAEAQTWVTIKNISELLAQKDLSLNDMAQVRIYVKDLDDAPGVMEICDRAFRNKPSVCVRGPICYEEMFMEIEGVAAREMFK